MHRFYLSPEACAQSVLNLTGREAHHATRVLRLKAGDALTVQDGQGHVLTCEITATQREDVQLSVKSRSTAATPPCRVSLFQALTKAKSFEWILQKATELGVAKIVPVLTERAVPEIRAAEGAAKREKWQWIAIDALKQSGAAWLPEVTEPIEFKQISPKATSDLNLVAALDADSRHPRAWFEEFVAQEKRSPGTVAIWIGPEGDFTKGELEALRQAGVLPITLGSHVLRAETAALYCLAVIQSELAWCVARD